MRVAPPPVTRIAIPGIAVDGAIETDRDIARIADVEIPVGRRVDDHLRRPVGELAAVHLEPAAALLPALRANFSHDDVDLKFSTFATDDALATIAC